MPNPHVIFRLLQENTDYTKVDTKTNKKLYALLNESGNDKRDQTGGLGSVFKKNTRWKEYTDEAFFIDDKMKIAYIKTPAKVLALAEQLHKDYSYQPNPKRKHTIKKSGNKNKAALSLVILLGIEDKTHKDTLNKASILLEDLFKDPFLKDEFAESRRLNIVYGLKDKRKEPATTDNNATEGETNTTDPHHIAEGQEDDSDEYGTPEGSPHTSNPAPEGSPAIPAIKEARRQSITPPIEQNKLDTFLQKLNEKKVRKNSLSEIKHSLKKDFLLGIKKLELQDLDHLNEKMNELQSGNEQEFEGDFFNKIRTERWSCFGGGNTDTWQIMRTAVKRQLLEKLKSNTVGNKLDSETYMHYHSLFSQHSGRFYARFGKTNSLKRFEKLFKETSEEEDLARKRQPTGRHR